MELLSHHHQYHHQPSFSYCDGGGGGGLGGGGAELIYKNFRKNMEFDIFFEKLKRNRYENQKLKQKKLVEKISLNIYIDEFNDYELSEHTVKEVDEFESLYLKNSRCAKFDKEKEKPVRCVETVEDSLFKSITVDTSLELNRKLSELACCKEDALYKKTTFAKKKEKNKTKQQQQQQNQRDQMKSASGSSPALLQQIYSNIIFYNQADDDIVSAYSYDLASEYAPAIPFYTFNATEEFDFNSYFLSTLKVCNFENKKRRQSGATTSHSRLASTSAVNSPSLSSHADSQSTTESQMAMLDDSMES